MTRPANLDGYRVLLVEDEALVAMYTEAVLSDAGARVAVAMRLETGLKVAEASAFDVAVLDMNLGGKSSLPIADLLADRKIPFLFVTGYGPGAWSGRHWSKDNGERRQAAEGARGRDRQLEEAAGRGDAREPRGQIDLPRGDLKDVAAKKFSGRRQAGGVAHVVEITG